MNEAGIEWGTVAQWVSPLVTALLAIWAVSRAGNKEAFSDLNDKLKSGFGEVRGDIDKLRSDDARAFQRIDAMEADMSGVKVEMRHLVTKEELHKLDRQLARIDEKMDQKFASLGDKIDTVISQTERAQERLARREDSMIERLAAHKDVRA